MELHVQADGLEVIVEAAQYSETTLHKCFYWYTRDYCVTIHPALAGQLRVQLVPKEGSIGDMAALQNQVHTDLLDFRLRELIAEETRPIRELLVAKAFAHYAPAQPLTAVISDPVGFHPLATGN
ncbi:MAG: His-Xaa-Ser system protein HxsD [Janthinobacterium lividum]